MSHNRATLGALQAINQTGGNVLDVLAEHHAANSGKTQIETPSGEVEITTEDGFTCVHLRKECQHFTTCHRNVCSRLKK